MWWVMTQSWAKEQKKVGARNDDNRVENGWADDRLEGGIETEGGGRALLNIVAKW